MRPNAYSHPHAHSWKGGGEGVATGAGMNRTAQQAASTLAVIDDVMEGIEQQKAIVYGVLWGNQNATVENPKILNTIFLQKPSKESVSDEIEDFEKSKNGMR